MRFGLAPVYRSVAGVEERISSEVAQVPEQGDYVKQLKRREFAQ
jgi:hypothetical protein